MIFRILMGLLLTMQFLQPGHALAQAGHVARLVLSLQGGKLMSRLFIIFKKRAGSTSGPMPPNPQQSQRFFREGGRGVPMLMHGRDA